MSTLVIADHDNQVLKGATRNTIAAASMLGSDVVVLVAGSDCQAVAQSAAAVAGVSKVLLADSPHYKDGLPESLADFVVGLTGGGQFSHILASATAFGKSVAPRIAAMLDVAQVSEIISVESPDTFVRPIYAGNAFATVQSKDMSVLTAARQSDHKVGKALRQSILVVRRVGQ